MWRRRAASPLLRAQARPLRPLQTSVRTMETLTTMTYEKRGRVAHIVLNRPHRGNGITFQTPLYALAPPGRRLPCAGQGATVGSLRRRG